MRPEKTPSEDPQKELFRVELDSIINLDHPMAKLSNSIDWQRLDNEFSPFFDEKNGRPAISTRLMVSLHYLKYTFDLSDRDVVDGWVENPYWQYLSGMKFFEHTPPINPSSMTRWRKRLSEKGAEQLLKETIESGLRMRAIKPSQMERVNIDTTVQEKDIRFPTDARLYDRAREKLVQFAKGCRIKLRQSYKIKGKEELLNSSRYAHARQMKRARAATRKLRTYLGRVIRDITRKVSKQSAELKELLEVCSKIYDQKRNDKNKIYSVHEPNVECISKGKAHKRYEFGVKVSVATTSKGGWFLGALAIHGNPYDGHTLKVAMEQISRLGYDPGKVFVDQGYRKHNYQGDSEIYVDKKRKSKTADSLWRWMKRRAAVEPSIGHLKQEHRMDRNRLKGVEGDKINATLSAAGMNFRKLLKFFSCIFIYMLERLNREVELEINPLVFTK